jgi:hypothetical protein
VNVRRKAAAILAAAPLLLLGAPVATAADTPAPASIPADCSADTTDALNAWIASLPAGATAALQAGGCYQLDRTLVISGKSGLTLDGNGATLLRKTPTPPELQYGNAANTTRAFNRHVFIDRSDHVVVRELTVRGLNTTSGMAPGTPGYNSYYEPAKFGSQFTAELYGEAGLMAQNVDYLTLQDFNTDATWGDGITLGQETGEAVNHAKLLNVSVDRNGRQGVALVAAEDALLDGLRVLHSYAVGVDIEPNGAAAGVRNVEIRNSTLNSRTGAFAVTGSAAAAARADGLYIHHNVVLGNNSSRPWLTGTVGTAQGPRSGWRITNNEVRALSYGITLGGVTDAVVRDNTFPSLAGQAAIRLNNVGGLVAITGNKASGASSIYSNDAAGTGLVLACGNTVTSAAPPAC